MHYFENSNINNHFSLHKVGNKLHNEPLKLSKESINLSESLAKTLMQFFLTSFKSEEYFCFHHDIGLSLNEVYTCVSKIFENPNELHNQSLHLANHLYNQSVHPKIKIGEFYVAYFEKCLLNGEEVDAVGLFKSENKDTFLEILQNKDGLDIKSLEGINTKKLDKGCLIFNSEKDKGFILSIIDNTNKGSEAQYWKDDFLSVQPKKNEYHQTNQFLGIAKQFVTKQIDEEFELSKADKIDFLNRSVDYFKKRETFDKNEFEEEVFGESKVIESFRKFDQSYRQENEVELSDNFVISVQAVKKQAKVFKSVLKLDQNFDIYIHGDKNLIEKGVENDGRKYYKIYYKEEK